MKDFHRGQIRGILNRARQGKGTWTLFNILEDGVFDALKYFGFDVEDIRRDGTGRGDEMVSFEIVGQKEDKYYQVYYEIAQEEEYIFTEEELRSKGWTYNEDKGVYYFIKINR